MPNASFTATPSQTNPAAVQAIYPSWLLNQLGSQYAAQYGYADTSLLKPVIHNLIVKSIPAQYGILKLLFDDSPIIVPDFEHSWYEREIPRPALTIVSNTTGATADFTLTSGGSANVSINDSVILPDERVGIVTAVNTTTNVITVKPQNGEPNITTTYTAGDTILIGYPVLADGQNFFSNYTRMTLKKYTNYVTRGLRAKRWTTETAIRYKNLQQVNYFEEDAAELMENVYNDMFYLFMNANKGEYDVTVPAGWPLTPGIYKQKVGDGIYPFLVKNGASHSTSTPATLEADFKTLAFGTNFKNIDDVRYVLATPKTLNLMSDMWKDPVQYAPSDTISSLDLREYRFGDMRFVPVPIVHWETQYNQFQPAWANRILVLDKANIKTVLVNGFQQIEANNTGSLSTANGGYNDYIDYFVRYCLGTRVTTVKGHFWMDMIGV